MAVESQITAKSTSPNRATPCVRSVEASVKIQKAENSSANIGGITTHPVRTVCSVSYATHEVAPTLAISG